MSDLSEALDAEQQDADADELRGALRRAQNQLRKAQVKREEFAEVIVQACIDATRALGRVPRVAAPKVDRRRLGEEVALWHLTDWQGTKVTTSYNSTVMRTRILRYCDRAARLTEIQRASGPVRDAVIMFGGDLGEGLFNYPTQPFEIDASIFGQFTTTARLVADTVRRALSIYRNVTVIQEWGNHGRIGGKRAAVPRSDNFDRMTYELARAILSDPETEALHPRLTWEDSAEDMQRVQIGRYRALLIHGDEFGRSGTVAKTTLEGKVADLKSGAYPWTFRDCYVGHYHTHAESQLPDGTGRVFWTGSPESDNRYARDNLARSGLPTQRLHFVDPERGRITAQYMVELERE